MSRRSPGRSRKGVHSGTLAAYFYTGTECLWRSVIKIRIKEWLHWGSSLPLHLKMGIFAEENEPSQSETHGYIWSLLSMGYSIIRKLYMIFLVGMGMGLSFRVTKMLSSLGND